MPFNSLQYFLFLPVVFLLFYFVSDRARWIVLLAASLSFYAALKVPYLLVVLALVAMSTYAFGIWLDQADNPKTKRALLWGGIATNVLILSVMKYLPFFSENLQALSSMLSWDAQIQPVKAFIAIGVSYYVFQAISYLFDIYLELEKPERHFGYFALYLAFFPKLLQGPIERAGDLIPQLKMKYEFNYDNLRFGSLLFTWGLFKKVVIADRIALYVDPVYNDVYAFTGLPLLLATYAYAFQIYMDFSGYTDMALGTALLFNITLTRNFNSPYLATSIADFWRRWHISFSRWVLDYIFKPLQMQWRNGKNWGTATALIITFLISGIWHGASWGFLIWGGLHGLYLACAVFYKPYQKKLHKALGVERTQLLKVWKTILTFNLVSFAWIFFRAKSVGDAWYVVNNILNGYKSYLLAQTIGLVDYIKYHILMGTDRYCLIKISAALAIYYFVYKNKDVELFKKPAFVRWICYYFLFYTTFAMAVESKSQFIYFKF